MSIPTPCHIIDLDRLKGNLEGSIKYMREETKCKVLIAIKGFSSDVVLPYMRDYLDGISASGAFEARLGKETIGKQVCTFSTAYKDNNIHDVVCYSNMVVFNSIAQFCAFSELAHDKGCSCGIRVNPEYSELPEDFGANPCNSRSHLGIRLADMPSASMFGQGGIEGIHVHTMCEQDSGALMRTIDVLKEKFGEYLKRIQWLNLGGGQMYAHKGYNLSQAAEAINHLRKEYDLEIYLEPCSGIMSDCGYYAVTIVDIVHNGIDIAITDGSGICHMPDAVYRDWRHEIKGAADEGVYPYNYKIAGASCYAGDAWGNYSFPEPLQVGQQIIFEDSAHYTMVKSSTFNGIALPSVGVYSKENGIEIKKQYDYCSFIRCQ